jgi:ACT domain-containing protein
MAKVITTQNLDEYISGNDLLVPRGSMLTHAARESAVSRGLKIADAVNDDESLLRLVTEVAAERLKARGVTPTREELASLVPKVIETIENRGYPACAQFNSGSGNVVLTAFGRDSFGIIAAITAVLAQSNISILDMNQRILQEFFSLVMILDMKKASVDFDTLRQKLDSVAGEKGIRIVTQLETIFKYMHRV